MTAEILEPRKRPTQERSQRKYDLLLQVSRALLLEVGFESFTCEEVAHRAELPIGTLYQFFANKYVIVCELNRQDLKGVQRELAEFDGEIPSIDWLRFLDDFLDHMSGLWSSLVVSNAFGKWYCRVISPLSASTSSVVAASQTAWSSPLRSKQLLSSAFGTIMERKFMLLAMVKWTFRCWWRLIKP